MGTTVEEINVETETQLGNYPKAFSHIGLINVTLYLSRTKGVAVPGPELIGIEIGAGSTVERLRE